MLLAGALPASAQQGCYFGVCPGDAGTEFPRVPTERLPAPAPAPDRAPDPPRLPTEAGMPPERIDRLCRGAHALGGEFRWYPPMGEQSALALCEAALRAAPDDPDLQFAYALTRDNRSLPGDDLYAATAYRALAAQGHMAATYTLATMHDENSGVTRPEAVQALTQVMRAEGPPGLGCMAMIDLYFDSLTDWTISPAEIAQLEAGARITPICADNVVRAYDRTPEGVPLGLPYLAYSRISAVHLLDPNQPLRLGAFYSKGRQAADTILEKFRPSMTMDRDVLRGGQWLLVGHYYLHDYIRPQSAESYASWREMSMRDPYLARAMQTALAELGFYKGAIDGAFGAQSRAALDRFIASDMVDPLFQALRATEPQHPLMPPVQPMRLGRAALAD